MLKHSYSSTATCARRAGLTLVEMLVAMTCTILLMFAITQTFQNIGEVSARGRAAIELSTQLRGVQHRLHKDLESLTVPVRPWPNATSAEGYFEILEGQMQDNPYAADGTLSRPDLYGDLDDIIAFTVRSTGEPFVGRFNGAMIQSQVAEVIWFTTYNDRDGSTTLDLNSQDTMNLHRRVLLVRPDLTLNNPGTFAQFIQNNDVSVRANSDGSLSLNSLADLTQRENRFAHVSGSLATDVTNGLLDTGYVLSGDRLGEDVMLSNVLAADVRVFDRQAVVRMSHDDTDALGPGDPGYRDSAGAHAHDIVGYGAYVDLYYSRNDVGTSEFSGVPNTKSKLSAAVYDTWSFWYEQDGIDQDGDNLIDEGVNGLDDDNQNGVDDVGERETSPPYPVPLRGVQVRIRVLEPETRQVRQATIVQDFIPE